MTEGITQKKAAERLGVDPKTIGRWLDAGVLRVYIVQGERRRRVTLDSVERYLSENSLPHRLEERAEALEETSL